MSKETLNLRKEEKTIKREKHRILMGKDKQAKKNRKLFQKEKHRSLMSKEMLNLREEKTIKRKASDTDEQRQARHAKQIENYRKKKSIGA